MLHRFNAPNGMIMSFASQLARTPTGRQVAIIIEGPRVNSVAPSHYSQELLNALYRDREALDDNCIFLWRSPKDILGAEKTMTFDAERHEWANGLTTLDCELSDLAVDGRIGVASELIERDIRELRAVR